MARARRVRGDRGPQSVGPDGSIRIDDYLFDKWEHPRKADVVSKVIGDFRGVNDLATYAKAFPRFLDALNRPQQASKAGKYSAAKPQPNAKDRMALSSDPNSSVTLSLTMDRSRVRFYEPQRKANCAFLCAPKYLAYWGRTLAAGY